MSQRVNELNQCLGEPFTFDSRFLIGASKAGETTIFRPACESDVEEFTTVAVGFGSSLA